jgi:DNA-binding NtrC family response regulator
MVEHLTATLLIMTADFQGALFHSERSVTFATECGQVLSLAASHGNHAHLLYIAGKLSEARHHSERALAGFSPRSDNYVGILDNLAQIELASGNTASAAEYIQQIDRSMFSETERRRYVFRHSLITKAKFERNEGLLGESLSTLDRLILIAKQTQDQWLLKLGVATRIGVLAELGKITDAIHLLDELGRCLTGLPPDLFAVHEGMLATCFAVIGRPDSAAEHLRRAERILDGLGHVTGKAELQQLWQRLSKCQTAEATSAPIDSNAVASGSAVRWIGALFSCMLNTELLAKEASEFLLACNCALCITVVRTERSGKAVKLLTRGDAASADLAPRRIKCGVDANGCTIDLRVVPAARVDAVATVNAMTTILQTLDEVNASRRQLEERVSLWPLDVSFEGSDAFIAGQLGELMQLAHRVARTNVIVLVTGESGTGKEIIARAIHNFSDRAKKPFVPFNCAAIPHDLAETQLFGHRRGAFTGADRDNLGVIRAARDGTLFLDEIGELALDLQPKLLRFLESGEIAPLGEPAPLTVNVRVVAATNRNLAELVQAGRFREDLFYRLNVVRLTVKPLRERRDEIPGLVHGFVARAATEFKKGHLEIAEETMERLILYRWPGNVRQLQNELHRIVALAEPGSTILPDAINEDIIAALPIARPAPRHPEIAVPLNGKLQPTLERIEGEMIKAALREHHGRVEDAAKALGISRKGLYLKRLRMGL